MTEHISDEMLTAFLDGELSTLESQKVQKAIATDPALSERLASLDIVTPDLTAAFDGILASAPAMPDLPPMEEERSRGVFGLAAAAIAGVAIGFGATFGFSQPQDPDWKEAIANYQTLYVPETLATAQNDTAQSERLAGFAARLDLDLAQAQTADGFDFRRVQMLGYEGSPLVQMAYVSETGEPFAFCITAVDEADYAPQTDMISGLAAAHWVKDGYGFLVIGGDDLSTVADFADGVHQQI